MHVVVDKSLLTCEAPIAFRASTATDTVFLSSSQIPAILAHLGVQHVEADFEELALASASKVIATKPTEAGKKDKKSSGKSKVAAAAAEEEAAGTVKIGVEAKKSGDFSKWYQQVLTRSEMLDYYDVSGCYIIRPLAYNIWREITSKPPSHGVRGCPFPILPKSF